MLRSAYVNVINKQTIEIAINVLKNIIPGKNRGISIGEKSEILEILYCAKEKIANKIVIVEIPEQSIFNLGGVDERR